MNMVIDEVSNDQNLQSASAQIISGERTCPVCSRLPLEPLSRDETCPPITLNLNDLDLEPLKEYSSQCFLCHFLLDLNRHWQSDQRNTPMEADEYDAWRGEICEWRAQHTKLVNLRFSIDFDSVLKNRIHATYVHDNPLSDLSVRRIQHWINRCKENHPKCTSSPKQLPTRVIDVRGSKPRLLDPSPDGSLEYATLSHCWGACRDFLTTRDTIEDRKAGFHLHELPATFRDAILVTKALGIPLLWIDSICIIQGDKVDWENEGSRMADVYSNATLCIGAADTNDDAQSFLDRGNAPCLPIHIKGPLASNSDQAYETHLYAQLYDDKDEPYLPSLHTRAWCLQEYALSPRMLLLGNQEMTWECLEDTYLETRSDALSRKSRMNLADFMPYVNKDGQTAHIPWLDMMASYSTRNITYVTDKLPAISAIAARVAQKTGDEYIAGIWSSDLIRGLLWSSEVSQISQQASQRSRDYTAPTWSWVSYPGPVLFHNQMRPSIVIFPFIKVLSSNVSVPGGNRFGQVEFGSLKLLTPVLSLEESDEDAIEKSWCCPHIPELGNKYLIEFDYPDKRRHGTLLAIPLGYTARNKPVDAFGISNENVFWSREQGPFGGFSFNARPIIGILVMEKNESLETLYERVGLFTTGPFFAERILDTLSSMKAQEITIV